MSSSRSSIFSSSSRLPRDFEDTLIFSRDLKLVKDWYGRQSYEASTAVKTMQLRNEYAVPFHQFIVIQTQGETGRAYRLDRGREKEGWSVIDTIRKLGVPPRDTIAVLQEPVEELDKTSHCAQELYCSDDRTINLLFVLSICFRIHNNWGTRYNLMTHNCYFFARTIMNTCDDKLDKESSRFKSIWRRVREVLYRRLALLLWVIVWGLVLALQLIDYGDVLGLVIGLVLGVVNMLFMLLVLLQIHVALAVRAVVGKVVKQERELELELEQGGVVELDLEELERSQSIADQKIEEKEKARAKRRVLVRIRLRVLAVLKWVLIVLATQVLPLILALLLMMLPLAFARSVMFAGGFFFGGVGIVILSPWVVWLVFLFHRFSGWRRGRSSGGGNRPLDTYAEKGVSLAVGAAEEPEQELLVRPVATGTSAHRDNGWTAVATEEDQDEVGSVTETESGDDDSDDAGEPAIDAGTEMDLEQGVEVAATKKLVHRGDGWTAVATEENQVEVGSAKVLGDDDMGS